MVETAALVASIYYRIRNKSGGLVWTEVVRSGIGSASIWDPSHENPASNEKPLFPWSLYFAFRSEVGRLSWGRERVCSMSTECRYLVHNTGEEPKNSASEQEMKNSALVCVECRVPTSCLIAGVSQRMIFRQLDQLNSDMNVSLWCAKEQTILNNIS